MLYIEIETDNGTEIFKLHKNIRLQMKLKAYLLSRFKEDVLVTVTDKGEIVDILKLNELFSK
jgi:hypothetical protein